MTRKRVPETARTQRGRASARPKSWQNRIMTIILLLAIGAVLWLSYKLAVAQGLIYTGVVD